MLIVCPNCATSYMIDPAALGVAGRTVRCARCKTTWLAGGPPQEELTAFVDSVIAEAEGKSAHKSAPPPAARAPAADDFGSAPAEPEAEPGPPPQPAQAEHEAPPADEDARHVEVSDAPSLVPPPGHAPLPDIRDAEPDSDDIESYAARRQRMQARRQKGRRASRWTAIVLLLFAFNVAVIGAREEVVRYLPQTALLFKAIGMPVNLRQLSFENVRISKDVQDGVNVLVVEGNIVSTANKPITVPRLRFAARDAGGQEIYTWTAQPSRSILGPGEKLEFRSRLASPPADARDVMVRFFNAQDAAGGK
jgi:predicted Zn finger-like uncharacterized protein